MEPIGFTAYPTETRDYNTGDLVIFDGVLANIGNYYDSETGIFTCSRNGTYVFTVGVIGASGVEAELQIMIDDFNYISTFSEGGNDVGTVSGVVDCIVNQKVWIRAGRYTRVYGSLINKYSVFSGYLFYAY